MGTDVAKRATPHPNPPPQGGREQTESVERAEYTSAERACIVLHHASGSVGVVQRAGA
jgi:hypothetical protein